MILHAPQLIWLGLTLIGIGVECHRHGELKKGKHDAGATLFASVIITLLLYWGGFFSQQ